MRQGLSGFLVRLGEEPDLFEEYMKNRGGVMEREGVTGADRDVILSGDLREIRARLRTEYSEFDEALVVMLDEPEPEEEPPTVMEPEEPPTVMEPEEPPTVMEPEEEPPVPEREPQAG
jgi:hypothetical protein